MKEYVIRWISTKKLQSTKIMNIDSFHWYHDLEPTTSRFQNWAPSKCATGLGHIMNIQSSSSNIKAWKMYERIQVWIHQPLQASPLLDSILLGYGWTGINRRLWSFPSFTKSANFQGGERSLCPPNGIFNLPQLLILDMKFLRWMKKFELVYEDESEKLLKQRSVK